MASPPKGPNNNTNVRGKIENATEPKTPPLKGSRYKKEMRWRNKIAAKAPSIPPTKGPSKST